MAAEERPECGIQGREGEELSVEGGARGQDSIVFHPVGIMPTFPCPPPSPPSREDFLVVFLCTDYFKLLCFLLYK